MLSPTPFNSELRIRIKTYEIDYIGHVNNAVYVRWLEDLRVHLFDTHFPDKGIEEHKVGLIIINTDIHYKKGIVLKDKFVDARLWIERFERASLYIHADFHVNGELRCSAKQRGTFLNTETQRIVRVPQGFRDVLEGK